ncbi:MAG: hypothetical protein HKO07_00180, partial [Pseudomonadales bacterium]|nr:hypothetical protein [Pseudomonadales bacterium]
MPKSSYKPKSMSKDSWRQAAEKSLKGASLDSLTWHTPEGIELQPLYTRDDLQGLEFTDTLPGFEPYI